MSALFGKVCQNGYVVRDIAAAMKFWTEVLRVGLANQLICYRCRRSILLPI